MKKIFLLSLTLFSISLMSCSEHSSNDSTQENENQSQAKSSSPVLATINGVELNQVHFALYKKAILTSQPNLTDNEILDKLIDFELISQEAKKENFQNFPDIAAKIHLQNNEFISDAYVKQFIASNNNDETELKIEYEKIKQDTAKQEFLIRHLFSEDRLVIEDLYQQINQSSFEQVANQHNQNNLGGSVGWIVMTELIEPIKNAALNLNNNELSQIIQSEYGYHLILIDKRRKTEFAPFEQVKNNLRSNLIAKKMSELLAELKNSSEIKRFANF